MELEKIRKIVAEILNIDPEEVKPERRFIEDLSADSLDVFQIIMGIEEEFDIEISSEAAEKVATVGEALELLRSTVKD